MSLQHDDRELHRIAHAIAMLDYDDRIATVINGLMKGCGGSPALTVHGLMQAAVALAALVNDDDMNQRIAESLRETANLYEASRIAMNGPGLN